jgi:acetolactate synthase-1/2/3 large subunit
MPGAADEIVSRMRAAGVRTIFGLPGGGGNLDIIDAAVRRDLPFVLTATETGSAIAALAQSEVTRGPGACITTLGPGAASVVNGVACASLDRAPVVVVTDRHPSSAGAFAHQRVDHRALLAPVTKWSGCLSGDSVAALDEGFARLAELPPGPVHFDWPGSDRGQTEVRPWSDQGQTPRLAGLLSSLDGPRPLSGVLSRGARKPLLIIGLAARRPEDAAAIRAFCESHGVPAVVTYKAKGVVPDTHPWFGGVFTHAALERALVTQADLLIGVGFDPVEILPRAWDYAQPIVSIAPWRMADDHVPFTSQIVGDIVTALGDLSVQLPPAEWDVTDVRASAEAAKAAVGISARGMTAQDTVRVAARLCSARSIVTVDAGAHMFPATILWPVSEPNGLLISNGLSTMGFALPAAIGAALSDRARTVVALTGDGGLLICLGELATAVRERLRIITIVFNDASLSLIEIKQQARQMAPNGVALGDVAWKRIAEGFGLTAWTASSVRELETALGSALDVDGPSLIEVRIDPSNYAATLKAIRG